MFLPQKLKAQGAWTPSGTTIVYTMRSCGVKTNSPSKDFDVNGSFRARTAVVDSILTVWKVMVADALSVGGNLNVSGNTQTATLSVSGNSQLNNVSANNITAAGNISAANVSSGNIFTLTTDVSNLQSTVGNQQNEIDTLQLAVGNIKSSQWKNDSLNSANIFYSGGNVGVGVSNPSEPLEVSGRIKVTGGLSGGSGGGNPIPVQSKSIIIDGGIDQITATSGTLNFSSTNLVSSGNIQSSSMSTAQLTISDKFISKSGMIDSTLCLMRDSATGAGSICTKSTDLRIQSDPTLAANTYINAANTGRVGIGTTAVTEKLTVAGNVSVSGNVSATCVNTGCLNVSGQTSFDSLKVTNTIRVHRVTALDGDSLIYFGDSSATYDTKYNRISWTPVSNTIKGFSMGTGFVFPLQGFLPLIPIGYGAGSIAMGSFASHAVGSGSITLGTNIKSVGNNSITIGAGNLALFSSPFFTLDNTIPNSLMVGFNSNMPTLIVTQANGINTIGKVCIGIDPNNIGNVQYPLEVCGTIRAKEMRVNLAGCDFVFAQEYSLPIMKQRKQKVLTQGYMLYMQTAKGKDEFSLNEITQGLWQNTEEHELYLYNHDERIETLENENKELKYLITEQNRKIEQMQKQFDNLKKR